MNHADHVALLRPAQPRGVWADLGSGTGAFSLALAELLGSQGSLVSVDQDAGAMHHQQRELLSRFPRVAVQTLVADFRYDVAGMSVLDGIVMANSLHFHRDPQRIVEHVCGWLKPGGSFVLIEYNADGGNHWVPHPVSFDRWRSLSGVCGLKNTVKIGGRPSRFLNEIYSALSQKPSSTVSS